MNKFGIDEIVQVWEDLGNKGYFALNKVKMKPYSCMAVFMTMREYLPALSDWENYFLILANSSFFQDKRIAINTALKMETLERAMNGGYPAAEEIAADESLFYK